MLANRFYRSKCLADGTAISLAPIIPVRPIHFQHRIILLYVLSTDISIPVTLQPSEVVLASGRGGSCPVVR